MESSHEPRVGDCVVKTYRVYLEVTSKCVQEFLVEAVSACKAEGELTVTEPWHDGREPEVESELEVTDWEVLRVVEE